MSDAETLRLAATAIRRAAKEATPGPWEWDDHVGGDGFVVLGGGVRRAHFPMTADQGQMPDAIWTSLMSPAVADPVAAWLEQVAAEAQESEAHGFDCRITGSRFLPAIRTALAVLGEDELT